VTSKNKKKLEGKEAQVSEPTPQSSKIGIRVCQQKKTLEFTIQACKIKVKSTQEEQVSRPTPVSKSKKRKLFEETPTHVSNSKKASLPIRRTTRSTAKQAITPNIPSPQREYMDIPSSPEKESGWGATTRETEGLVTISEMEGLVTETLMDLRKRKEAQEVVTQEALTPSPGKSLSRRKMIIKALRSLRKEKEAQEMVAKKVLTPSPDKSLNEQTLLTEIERLKQEVEEYKILGRHIKAENAELKE
jgi:hypothetical protein